MKKITGLLVCLFAGAGIYACPLCNRSVSQGIYDSQFYPNLFIMLSAFVVLTIIVAFLSAISTRRYRSRVAMMAGRSVIARADGATDDALFASKDDSAAYTSPRQQNDPVPLTTASMVLGIGLGGFIDGIVLHQVLQVHEMLSARVSATNYIGKSINMFWDGVFHSFCLIVVIVGVILLWKLLPRTDINRSGKLLAGGMLMGWALFNIVEGLIDHHLLKLHNVVELSPNPDVPNYLFLFGSVLLLGVGYIVKRSGRSPQQGRR